VPQEPAETPGGAGIQLIARAAAIMRALAQAPGGLTQADLYDRLGLPRSTVHRIVGALVEEGLVAVTHSRGRYRLGPDFARMAEAVRRDFLDIIHPLLEDLSRRAQETVDLSVLDNGRVTFLDQVVAPHRLRAVSAVGESFPLHACAPGKAFLAAMLPHALAAALPAKLPPLTPRTITTMTALRKELGRIREDGVAFDREEHTAGICAVAVVLGDTDLGSAAVSLPMPSQRFYGHEEELRRTVLEFQRRWADSGGPGR
jgi:DNA-binding IclR family transcriptional regulator